MNHKTIMYLLDAGYTPDKIRNMMEWLDKARVSYLSEKVPQPTTYIDYN